MNRPRWRTQTHCQEKYRDLSLTTTHMAQISESPLPTPHTRAALAITV
jgi:hypothetical protein